MPSIHPVHRVRSLFLCTLTLVALFAADASASHRPGRAAPSTPAVVHRADSHARNGRPRRFAPRRAARTAALSLALAAASVVGVGAVAAPQASARVDSISVYDITQEVLDAYKSPGNWTTLPEVMTVVRFANRHDGPRARAVLTRHELDVAWGEFLSSTAFNHPSPLVLDQRRTGRAFAALYDILNSHPGKR